MPLSDWRDGEDHADAHWGSVHDLGYLKANVAGGEGFDWYYPDPEAEAAQRRVPITDGAHGEAWVWRYKDLRGWWAHPHHDRVGGVRRAQPTAWEPQSKPIWFTELGCPAIDRGTNQPNVFLDPKSSESFLPRHSSGRRDDFMQMQYLRAMAEYWDDPANNPESELYAGRMVDTSRAFVWCWDTRPFPQFPGNLAMWSDGDNYSRGHWVSGRSANQPLAAVVAEICEGAGLRDFDVSGLHGAVRGYLRDANGSGRAALQPLMLAYGFEALERGGRLVFRMRHGRVRAALSEGDFAVHPDLGGTVEAVRAPVAETVGRVRLVYTEAEGDFDVRAEEAVFPDDTCETVSQSETALVLTRAEARGVTERWLAEARVARDGARFALPPSRLALGPGDVVELPGAAGRFRIDRIEKGGAQLADAVRVEPAVYVPSDHAEDRAQPRPFVAPVPVAPVFLDLPLLRGGDDPVAPWVAVTARPWPGAVAVWDAISDEGYALNTLVGAPASLGVTLGPLFAAPYGRWDRGPALRLRLARGQLASASEAAVFAGANVLAIGAGDGGPWEVMQFREAVPVAPRVWDIRLRLRGQAGTDGVMPGVWPAGSRVVVLDGALKQVVLDPAARGLVRHWRVGVAARPHDDPSVVHRVLAFDGAGLRPWAPAHLRVRRGAGGTDHVSWVRRARLDGDGWALEEVPLGEAAEVYRLRVLVEGEIRREEVLAEPRWSYPAGERAADGIAGPWRIEVAQVSDRFGPGPFKGIDRED